MSLLILGLSSSLAFAANLAVYPFSSPDILTGVAISERVASAFSPLGDVLGPVETPSLIPPLVVEGGFLSPVVFLPSNVQANGLASPEGAALVQGSLGADAAVTGALRFEDARLVLELFVADFRGMRSYTLYAPEDNPGDLAEQTVALLLRHLSVRNERLIRRVLRTDTDIDLSSDYSEYVRAVALIGGGFANEAEAVLASLADETDGELPRAWRGLALALEGIRQGEASRNVLRDAALALSLNEVNEQQVIGYFETLAADEVLPAANVWLGTLRSDVNDRAGSNSAFEAAATYPYGRAARATYLAVNRLEGATDIINQLTFEDDIAALIAASYAAFELDENGLEKTIHTRLNRIAPGLSYPFERLSFIAFDEDDADAATQALVVATRIEPDEDLYWTNLGWSYYLQGRLEESRIASQRAVTLEPAQEIAWFNLGLAYAVDGDLEQALPAYESALELDPEVNDEAVVDLENALVDYPGVAGVNFALATLYEAEGRKDESIDQFEAYLSQLEDDTSPFGRTALQRLEVLRAPPPPLEIGDEVNVTLGREGDVLSSFEPGDRIYPAFELFTPGIELPRMVMVSYDLIDPSGDSILNEPLIQESDIPQNVVAID
ncbi:MAG: tetratricopeptide repeat protein, partial [Deinococcota bacterium]